MKKIDLGQTISILANIGVLAGIAFLAVELRQNTVAVRTEASQGLTAQLSSFYSLLLTDGAPDIYRRGLADAAQLDPTERVVFSSLLNSLLASFENQFALVTEGSYDESRARGYWQNLRNLLEYASFQQHWERTRYLYNEAFQEHVENYVMTLEPSGGSTLIPVIE